MTLVPGDDASLIAASNLAAQAGPLSADRSIYDAVLAELKRRGEFYERAKTGGCCRCGKPLWNEDGSPVAKTAAREYTNDPWRHVPECPK